jgi:flagellar protein FliJ
MTKSKRIGRVQRVADVQERRKAAALAASEQRMREGESKLRELEGYRDDYRRAFAQRAAAGIDAAAACDYRVFLARLDEAVRQQAEIVKRERAQREADHGQWQGAAQRAEALERTVQHLRAGERRSHERREQLESDELSQRRRKPGASNP